MFISVLHINVAVQDNMKGFPRNRKFIRLKIQMQFLCSC